MKFILRLLRSKPVLIIAYSILLVGLVIRFSIKDTYYISSLVYYTLPLPILGFGVIAVGVLERRKRLKNLLFILGIVCIGVWINTSYRFSTGGKQQKKKPATIVYWNAAKRNNFIDGFELLEELPDVLVLGEYDQTKKDDLKSIRKKYRSGYFRVIYGKIGVFSKSPIRNVRPIKMKNYSFLTSFTTKIKGKRYYLYAIDITANLKCFRKPMLEEALGHIKKRKRTFVLGDFNTPYESIHFDTYRQRFSHVFDAKGEGFRETWFYNVPLLSLDHIWCSKDVELISAAKLSNWESDHALLRVKL